MKCTGVDACVASDVIDISVAKESKAKWVVLRHAAGTPAVELYSDTMHAHGVYVA